jgi:hypothetical protein
MPLSAAQIEQITAAGDAFLPQHRPPVEIRHQVDLAYRLDGQSVMVFEVRPDWMDKSVITHEPVAKATFVQTENLWKVYWMRADLKWHAYTPKPHVKTITAFFKLVAEDKNACFFG